MHKKLIWIYVLVFVLLMFDPIFWACNFHANIMMGFVKRLVGKSGVLGYPSCSFIYIFWVILSISTVLLFSQVTVWNYKLNTDRCRWDENNMKNAISDVLNEKKGYTKNFRTQSQTYCVLPTSLIYIYNCDKTGIVSCSKTRSKVNAAARKIQVVNSSNEEQQ